MRVCHPMPVDLNASSTSRDSLIEMRSLVNIARGRPTRFILENSSSVSGKESGSDIAAAVIAASSSGVGHIVPGLSLGISEKYISAFLTMLFTYQLNQPKPLAIIYANPNADEMMPPKTIRKFLVSDARNSLISDLMSEISDSICDTDASSLATLGSKVISGGSPDDSLRFASL